MKQEEIDKLMHEINRKCKLPKNWNKFIEENSNNHNIIIKDNKTKISYCTKCNNYFDNKSVKVRDYITCPHCNKVSPVLGCNYYKRSFIQPVVLVQRMGEKVIIRIFEIYSYFNIDCKEIQRSCVEYCRIIPGIGRFLGSNTWVNNYGTITVYHNRKKITWHTHNGHRFYSKFPTYPFNKKRLLKGTLMEYAPIDEFVKKFNFYGYNFLDVLELAGYGSFELLWNMKLYNLCFHSKALNKSGSFYKRFGVPKSFLKFMQDNDITYKELLILRLFQKADAELFFKFENINFNHLRFLVKNNILTEFLNSDLALYSYTNIKLLKEISKFVSLKKVMNYHNGIKNLNIYKDYLQMANDLALNYKSKKDLFPRNLISRHDKMQKDFKITQDINTQFSAYLRYLELSKYTYSDNTYIIFPAPSVESMKDESAQQGNCVGKLYLRPYIDGETEIFFIRKLDNVCKSLITLEYKNGYVVQKELANHKKNFSYEQNAFINKWLGFRLFIDNKEKIENKKKNKSQISIQKYKLKNMVA